MEKKNVYSLASDRVLHCFFCILKLKYLEFPDLAVRTHVGVPGYPRAPNNWGWKYQKLGFVLFSLTILFILPILFLFPFELL